MLSIYPLPTTHPWVIPPNTLNGPFLVSWLLHTKQSQDLHLRESMRSFWTGLGDFTKLVFSSSTHLLADFVTSLFFTQSMGSLGRQSFAPSYALLTHLSNDGSAFVVMCSFYMTKVRFLHPLFYKFKLCLISSWARIFSFGGGRLSWGFASSICSS